MFCELKKSLSVRRKFSKCEEGRKMFECAISGVRKKMKARFREKKVFWRKEFKLRFSLWWRVKVCSGRWLPR